MRSAGRQTALLTGMLLLISPVGWTQEDPAQEPRVGLSIRPGGMLIQDVSPGEVYDLNERSGVQLTISNQGPKPVTYQVSSHQPSKVGNGKWLEGYQEIPDPAWLSFNPTEVTVGPWSDGFTKMYLKVPEGGQYHNQHWVVSASVRGQAQPGEALALAVYPRYQIETTIKSAEQVVPAGPIGLEPSLVRFNAVRPGVEQEQSVTLCNNSSQTQTYDIGVQTVAVDPTREQIVPSPGFAWIPEPDWLVPELNRLTLDAGEQKTVTVRAHVPASLSNEGRQWEALCWIRPVGDELPRFARIQVVMMRAESQE